MLCKRIIPCLDVLGGRVVKGTNFVNLKDAGDAIDLARRYNEEGADELVFLDIGATIEDRQTMLTLIESCARELFIPLCVGGGIRSVEDAIAVLRVGADKVSVNSAAVQRPDLLTELADQFGRQAVVLAIDAKQSETGWKVFTHAGKQATGLDVIEWARRGEGLGAGEILLTSIDTDGKRDGFALDLCACVADSVGIPVIASGGAGTVDHFVNVFQQTKVQAALAAGTFHQQVLSISEVKQAMADAGIPTRRTP